MAIPLAGTDAMLGVIASRLPSLACSVMSAGVSSVTISLLGDATGHSGVSDSVTVKEHVVISPAASVAVLSTSVAPSRNSDPDGGLLITVTVEQLSLAVTVKLTGNGSPPRLCNAMFAGQSIVGGCWSITVTLKVQMDPTVLVAVTEVTPTGNKLPEEDYRI